MSDRAKRLGLEPGSIDPIWSATDPEVGPTSDEVAHSIAISLTDINDSLKRIADTLTGTSEQANLYNLLTDIVWQAGQSFERGRGAA